MYQPSIRFLSLFSTVGLCFKYRCVSFLSLLRYTHLFFCLLKFVFEEGFTTLYIRILNRNMKKELPIQRGGKASYSLVLEGILFFKITVTLLKQKYGYMGFALYIICFHIQ
jgi:hypothetical protein